MLVRRTLVVASAALVLFGWFGLAIAQEKKAGVEVQAGQGKVSVNVNVADNQNDASRRMIHSASTIEGMAVHDSADRQLGTVNDIVINLRTGKVRYAALSYGGFLGFGDKLFAVPWNAFDHRHDAKTGKHTLILNIDEATLKNAPGFDKGHWPNFADSKFNEAIEKHYEKARTDRGASVDLKNGTVAVNVNADQNRDQADSKQSDSSKDVVRRAKELVGMTVKNSADKELGAVEDLMIEMETGNVRYAAITFGGLFGFGAKLFAVPWAAFDLQHNPSTNRYHMVLTVDEATLRKAPGFDRSNWPNFADPTFSDEVDKHFGTTEQKTDRPTSRVD